MSVLKTEVIRNHLIEPGGSMGIHGDGYDPNSKFNKVDITISNNKEYPIMVTLTDTGIEINLVRDQ